jgi:hypothetical protein
MGNHQADTLDMNPACAKEPGLNPPFTEDCEWEWG